MGVRCSVFMEERVRFGWVGFQMRGAPPACLSVWLWYYQRSVVLWYGGTVWSRRYYEYGGALWSFFALTVALRARYCRSLYLSISVSVFLCLAAAADSGISHLVDQSITPIRTTCADWERDATRSILCTIIQSSGQGSLTGYWGNGGYGGMEDTGIGGKEEDSMGLSVLNQTESRFYARSTRHLCSQPKATATLWIYLQYNG